MKTRAVIALIAAPCVILLIFVAGEFLERVTGHSGRRALGDTIQRLTGQLSLSQPDSKLLQSGLPVYDLRIAPKQMARLHDTMLRVQTGGSTDRLSVEPEYEKASFLADGQWISVEVKLRGWTANHYFQAYPSFRVKFPGNRLLKGKRQINLVDPYDKFLTADMTTKWEAEQHEILAWEGRFVIVRINDRVRGLYLEIEQIRRELTDRHDRPEGHVFSPNGKLYGSPKFGYERAAAARDLLQQWAENPSSGCCRWESVEEYFDVDKMAWAAAIMTLSGHWGNWLSDNVRLYFDPARGKFEPIPWDYGFLRLSVEPVDTGFRNAFQGDAEAYADLGRTLLSIPEFRELRDRRLWTLVNEHVEPMVEHSEKLFDSIRGAVENGRRRIGPSAAESMQNEFVATLRHNASLLMRLFAENRLKVTCSAAGPEGWVFHAENHGKTFVVLRGVLTAADGRSQEHVLARPIHIPGRWEGRPGRIRFVERFDPQTVPCGLLATNGLTGENLAKGQITFSHSDAALEIQEEPAEQRYDLQIAGVELGADSVRFRAGTVELRESIEIPAAFDVVFEPGLTLIISPEVSLIICGDLDCRGQADRSIRIGGRPGEPSWGTLAVLGTRTRPSRVTMMHTVIEGGAGGSSRRSVQFTGALSVHDGKVLMRDVQVVRGSAEDGVNLKYAEVDLERCTFESQISDAVDLDFCRGTVRDCRFAGVGGDGLDVSGSTIDIQYNLFAHCGDKGISVGERSSAVIGHNDISHCVTGVAVKDASRVEIRENDISHHDVGIAAYVKKPSFGPPEVSVARVQMDAVETAFLLGPGITIDNRD